MRFDAFMLFFIGEVLINMKIYKTLLFNLLTIIR